ncbi:MAG TPA: hypothetical protein VK137_15055 [Planctomycetaceae bacterium]|nr:hypothetical protein [Planctomycetaceae bacterium]
MPAISLKAHFDGQYIQLDEPFELPRDASLLVTVLSPSPLEQERQAWFALSTARLAAAYGDAEPDYSDAVLTERRAKAATGTTKRTKSAPRRRNARRVKP